MSLRGQYRHLTLRHERHLLNNTRAALAPGEAQFSSYYLPSLPAGTYGVQINQMMKPPSEDSRHRDSKPQRAEPAKREFEVLAPQWTLRTATDASTPTSEEPDKSAVVLSMFPAPGDAAPSFATLPHMVLRDPQMPWIRRVSENNEKPDKNVVPWFALLVFTADELELNEEEGESFFKHYGAKLNDSLGWDTLAAKVKDIKDSATGKDRLANFIPEANLVDIGAKTETSLIAVPRSVFTNIFARGGVDKFDVTPFRFMSHVRTVATDGMMSAAIAEEDSSTGKIGAATYSIVVSPRLGPDNVNVPTPVLAHLVSLQGIDQKDVSLLTGKERVLMTSLYSWTYTALPPDSVDLKSALRQLGNDQDGGGLSVLRTTNVQDPSPPPPKKPDPEPPIQSRADQATASIVTKRQADGYTLIRHRTVTGEQTAAMYRGPLVPTRVPHPLQPGASFQSNFGTDLQILDPDLDLMDISYASAWQLGKTLALGDRSFTVALARLRTSVHSAALDSARRDVFRRTRDGVTTTSQTQTTYRPQDEFKSDIGSLVDALDKLDASVHATGSSVSTNRWRRRETLADVETDDLSSLRSPHIYSQIHEHAAKATFSAAEAVSGTPYNYHLVPKNTDWATVQEWILNQLYLAGIPAHYLLPDPSHIPQETLRFFHIDANWTEALVDGALSLANHVASTPEEDFCRTSIKQSLNRYFKTPLIADYYQQMPVYGCFLRSQLLIQFPDLTVSAKFEEQFHIPEVGTTEVPVTPKAPILVQRKLAPDIMLLLFDRQPPGLVSLTFTLPAHQQTFIAATKFHNRQKPEDPDMVEIFHKRIYATGLQKLVSQPDHDERIRPLLEQKYDRKKLFDWGSRMMNVQEYADLVHRTLCDNMPTSNVKQYQEEQPTAAVLALQLNEPIYSLVVDARVSKTQDAAPGCAPKESLPELEVLPDTPQFNFYPPPFPAHNYKPTSPLPVPPSAPVFTPMKLSSAERAEMSTTSWTALSTHDNFASPEFAAPTSVEGDLDLPDLPAPRPANQPSFDISVRPIDNPPLGFVPTNRGTPSDLVFSITIPSNVAPWNYRLMRIELQVKIGETTDVKDPNDTKTLRALVRRGAEQGPPPTMLSNLRFNVLRKWNVELGILTLTVVPRTAWGVNITTLKEASFLFPMATVVPWKVPKGKMYPSEVQVQIVTRPVDSEAETCYFQKAPVYMAME